MRYFAIAGTVVGETGGGAGRVSYLVVLVLLLHSEFQIWRCSRQGTLINARWVQDSPKTQNSDYLRFVSVLHPPSVSNHLLQQRLNPEKSLA